MSSPWAWLGNEFPSLQQTISSAATGDGTDYQVIWNMVDGIVTDDQICKFEWTAKTITLTISGTATMPFFVASTGMTETHAVGFSKTLPFSVNSASATWDGNEIPNGSDYGPGSTCTFYSSSNTFSVSVTLSDGTTSSAGFNIAPGIGFAANPTPGVAGLYGITESLVGRVYARYTKEVVVFMSVNSNTGSPFNLTMNLNKTALSGTPVSLGAQTCFHTTALVYYSAPMADGSTLSLSAFSLSVSAASTTPPNI